MNQTAKYVKLGLWVFALIAVVAFATIYASQTGLTILLYAGIAINLILSLFLFLFVLQLDKGLKQSLTEIARLEKREQDRLLKERHAAEKAGAQVDEFKVDDVVERIMPASETTFDNVRQYTEKILQNIAKELGIVQGLAFVLPENDHLFHVSGEYAYFSEEQPRSFAIGKTLSGQVAKNQQLLNVKEMPEGYITILSGLGKGNPRHLVIAPIVYNGESIGVIELASFKPFGANEEQTIRKVAESMVGKLNELRK